MKKIDWWISWCRACFFCRTSFGRIDFLCADCRKHLQLRALPGAIREHEFPVRSALLWAEGDQPVSELLYSLKGGSHRPAFDFLAKIFFQQHLWSGEKLKKPVFVPAPPRNGGETDHAHVWAESLAQLYGGEVRPILQRTEKRVQKELSVWERAEKKLNLVGQIGRDEKLIFCDDVVTSGSTAKAAFRALQSPLGFEVWSIAYRPKRTEGDLLQNVIGLAISS